MDVKVGTFNLNNLFSRYNFRAEIKAVQGGTTTTSVSSNLKYTFDDAGRYRIRKYKGKLVEAKDTGDTAKIAERITALGIDVLAVQEVEDIDTLRDFNRNHLGGLYPHLALIEGNDPRLIDLGVLSKLPLGGVTSWQNAVHPEAPAVRVFGRDLLEVEVLSPGRSMRLFTLFNNHLKSNYVDWKDTDKAAAKAANDARRTRQSTVVAEIVKRRTRPDSRFLILGDMNDAPDSPALAPFVNDAELDLTNGLTNPVETREPKADNPPPASSSWTHRYKPSGQPAQYELLDQIWLSRSLANKQTGAGIDRRTKHGGDGSDHDPAYVSLTL